MPQIILASASPRRKELLERTGIKPLIRPYEGKEEIKGDTPARVVENLSYCKADGVRKAITSEQSLDAPFRSLPADKADFSLEEEMVIIGADTVVALDGNILGKPQNEERAFEALMALQGRTHQVYTGVTLFYLRKGEWHSHTFHACTDVTFYPVSPEEIRTYIRTGEPMDKAGSYGIQGLWGEHVEGIRGDYQNVVGLPVPMLLQEAKKLGLSLKASV